jgi:cytochrome c oxidase subunit 3
MPVGGLALATLLILACSIAVSAARRAARKDREVALRIGLLVTFVMFVGFLFVQSMNWWTLTRAEIWLTGDAFSRSFYVLTGLHALHILCGLVPVLYVLRRALAGAYSAHFHPGVTYLAMYVHFLDVTWLVLLVSLCGLAFAAYPY